MKIIAPTALALAGTLALSSCASSDLDRSPTVPRILTREVTYDDQGTVLTGYMARPAEQDGPVPGVLVVHEWWGHNDYVRLRARELAELGYVAFAVDMYGGGKQADHPADATAFMNELMGNEVVMERRFDEALELLHSLEGVDPERTGAIGYCMGGGIVLAMARAGADLDAVASFHGSLGAALEGGSDSVDAEVLVCTGADDPFVPAETVAAFEESWQEISNAPFTVVTYPGALHGFTNPEATAYGERFDLPLRYDEEADRKSWLTMKAMFARVFE